MKAYRYFKVVLEGSIGTVKMNRPPANAFNLEFVNEFSDAIEQFTVNPEVRVMIIMSDIDKIFATGADIKLMSTMDNERVHSGLIHLLDRIQSSPKPVIAMINGHALGGGCELALCCDFRFMEKDRSRIGLPEINLGIISAAGGTQRLCQLLGRGKAIELLFEGAQISAGEALNIGLIHKAFNREELMEKTVAYANKLANQAPIAIGLIKKCINEGVDADLKKGLALEREALLTALQTEDAKEGIQAYLEKRVPKFRGR